jgi:3-oxoacyl-[acyl-carrier-protein] synthase-3
VFNFTIKTIPPLIEDTLRLAGRPAADVDFFVFHQSNRFIINHLIGTCSLPADRVPIVLDRFGNPGGPSLPLTITQGLAGHAGHRALSLMLLGYGVGLSWGAALVRLPADAVVCHVNYTSASAATTG